MASLTESAVSPTLSLTLPEARSTLPSFLRLSSLVRSPAASLARPWRSSVVPSFMLWGVPGSGVRTRGDPGREPRQDLGLELEEPLPAGAAGRADAQLAAAPEAPGGALLDALHVAVAQRPHAAHDRVVAQPQQPPVGQR